MKSPVSVALAGAGGYGALYLDALLDDARAEQVRLVGVVEPRSQACPRLDDLRRRGCAVHATLQSLFDSVTPDLLVIAAPTHFHARMTCAALARGVNVLCEKPLAGSLADALHVAKVQHSSRAFAAIGYQWSFSAAVQLLKRDIMHDVLGRPLRMRSIASYPRGVAYYTRNDWAGRIVSAAGDSVMDSPVNNATAHFLHNMLYLLGPTREISATPRSVQAELYRANDIENYDTAAIRCEAEEGVELLFYTTHVEPRSIGPAFVLEFTRATVTYDARTGTNIVARFADGRVREYGNPDIDRFQPLWQCVEATRTGTAIACGVDAAMAQTLCMSAAQRLPIVEFPRSLHRPALAGDDPMIAIDGLGDVLEHCYADGVLPSEMADVSWAQPAHVLPLHAAPAASHAQRHAADGVALPA